MGHDLWLDGWEMSQGADKFCISPDLVWARTATRVLRWRADVT